jgi:hypothetical protein
MLQNRRNNVEINIIKKLDGILSNVTGGWDDDKFREFRNGSFSRIQEIGNNLTKAFENFGQMAEEHLSVVRSHKRFDEDKRDEDKRDEA